MSIESKDAKKVRTFMITTYTKGFISSYTIDGIVTNEYFQFKEIYQVIHYPNIGVEIVNYTGLRRVFYNDASGESQILFNSKAFKQNCCTYLHNEEKENGKKNPN